MIALNIFLMTAVAAAIASLLAWAIVSDRRSKRAAGTGLSPADAPLTQDLVMPRELRVQRSARPHATRAHRAHQGTCQTPAHSPVA